MITASSEFREKERLRAKARYDEAQALYHARKERDIEILQQKQAGFRESAASFSGQLWNSLPGQLGCGNRHPGTCDCRQVSGI